MKKYQELLHLESANFSRIDHEDAMVAVVYKVTKNDGSKFILKICEREKDYFRELHFLKLLESQIPVPKIIQNVPPQNQVHGAILMECLSGELLQASEMTDTLAQELGRVLAQVHTNRLSGYGDPSENGLKPDSKSYLTFKFEEGLEECRKNLPLELIAMSELYYKTHLGLLETVDGPCIVHRDFRPGNLMIHEGVLQGVIDWAGARASFAEEDFCSLFHKPWLNQHLSHFISGYESVRPVPQYARLLSFLRLNKAIATIGFTVKRGTWDTKDASIYQFNLQFLKGLLLHSS